MSHLKGKRSVKSLSETRWAARASATSTFYEEYRNIYAGLTEFSNGEKVKPEIRCKAKGLQKNVERFETAYLSTFWSTILERFNCVSKRLQEVNITTIDML